MKILVAEDDLVLRQLLTELLQGWGHSVVVACDGAEALATFEAKTDFDMIILDWIMPQVSGVEVCRQIRQRKLERYPYVLLLTVKSQLDDLVTGLDAGADEYLKKPYRPAELAARLRAAERFLNIQNELLEAKRLISYQAHHDPTTGALNRATFFDRLERTLQQSCAAQVPVSVVRLELLGVSFGAQPSAPQDLVVQRLAEALRIEVGDGAIFGRTGSAEFMVVLPGGGELHARALATLWKQTAESTKFATPQGEAHIRVRVDCFTGHTDAERDLGWVLCAFDAMAFADQGSPTERLSA